MKRPALAGLTLLAACLGISGCAVLQGSYDSQARTECQDIPDVEDRLNCEIAVEEAKGQRRQDALREN